MKEKPGTIYSFPGTGDGSRELLNSLRVGVFIQGPRAEILFSNTAALDMLGVTEEELYGQSSFDSGWNAIHPDGSLFPTSTHPVEMALTTKKRVANITMGVLRRDAKERVWLSVNAEPLLDHTGQIKQVICSFSDITQHKRAEEQLTWLYQSLEVKALELATTNAELERFAYVATHDLQEPLRMVSSFMQLLQKKYEGQLDEQARDYIHYAVEGANRMKKLILDLLEFSRVSSSRGGFNQTDMNSVVREACGVFLDELNDSGAKLIISELPIITANTLLMVQLFENLIGNALKYRSSGIPVIQIDCKEEKNDFLFSITDNGIGIDAKYGDKIFILFQRLHNDSEAFEGTGVGLAICKKIVEMHRGAIWVVSEPGNGSTFYFTIARE